MKKLFRKPKLLILEPLFVISAISKVSIKVNLKYVLKSSFIDICYFKINILYKLHKSENL